MFTNLIVTCIKARHTLMMSLTMWLETGARSTFKIREQLDGLGLGVRSYLLFRNHFTGRGQGVRSTYKICESLFGLGARHEVNFVNS